MKVFLALLVVVGAASADLSAVADSILQETRSHLKNELDFPPFSYESGKWNPDYTKFDVSGKLETPAGKLVLGEFGREQVPDLWGTPKDGKLETTFFIKESTLTYEKFSAVNYISGEKSEGQLTITFGRTEMYSLIDMKLDGKTCTTEVSTWMPIGIGKVTAHFSPESKLAEGLWAGSHGYLNSPLNSTIFTAGWPEFAKVVEKTDLCTLLS